MARQRQYGLMSRKRSSNTSKNALICVLEFSLGSSCRLKSEMRLPQTSMTAHRRVYALDFCQCCPFQSRRIHPYLAIELFGQESHLLNDQSRRKLRQLDDEGRDRFRSPSVVRIEFLVSKLPGCRSAKLALMKTVQVTHFKISSESCG